MCSHDSVCSALKTTEHDPDVPVHGHREKLLHAQSKACIAEPRAPFMYIDLLTFAKRNSERTSQKLN